MKALFTLVVALACCLLAFGQDMKAEKAKLDKLEKHYLAAKASGAKAKAGTPKFKAYVEATVAYGNLVMTSPALTPKEKYPKALALFREALKVDPKNKVALENKNMIEQIYKSMGRPIPKG
jgi:tetratricopeptide (TPR) repeat protein